METTKTSAEVIAEGRGKFVPIPNLDKIKVGHAGLYVEETAYEDDIETEVIIKDIELKDKGASCLIACEHGIVDFVKKLSKDKSNHLPNSILGVFIHYLTEGIQRDFNRTWDETPYCLKGKKSIEVKAREQGKRVLSKKEKNELLEKLTYQYYENDVNSGLISQAEAFQSMAAAAAEKKRLEDAGFFISKNKTEGVSLFDWKQEVGEASGNPDAYKLYNKYHIEPVVPNIASNYFSKEIKVKKLKDAVNKSILAGAKDDMSNPEIYDFLKSIKKYADDVAEIKSVKGIHLVKIKRAGMMKPRYVCIETNNQKGEQVLILLGDDATFRFV
jgi:hypothetical protein